MANAQLSVNLDFKARTDALNKAQSALNGLRGTLGLVAGAAGVGSLGALASQAIESASLITDLSNQVKVSTDAWQVYAFAAREAGLEETTLATALRNTVLRAQDAVAGNASLAASFASLGLNAQAFLALDPDKRLETLARAITSAKDQNAAYVASAEILGAKAGPQLTAVLQRLATEGFDGVSRAAQEANQIISGDTVATLDDFGDSLDRVKTGAVTVAASVVAMGIGFFDTAANILLAVKNGQTYADVLADQERVITSGIAADTAAQRLAETRARITEERARVERQLTAAITARAEAQARADAQDQAITDAFAKIAQDAALAKETVAQALADSQRRLAAARFDAQVSAADAAGRVALLEKHLQSLQTEAERIRKTATDSFGNLTQSGADNLRRVIDEATATRIALEQAQSAAANPPAAAAPAAPQRFSVSFERQSFATMGEGATASLNDYVARVGTAGDQIYRTFGTIFQGIEQGISGSIQGLINGTMTWGDALANIGNSIVQAVIQAFANMAAQWIVQQILMLTVGKALQAAAFATTLPLAVASAAAWAPAAVASSIATFGASLANGPLAIAQIKAAGVIGAFQEGGYTGNQPINAIAGVVHGQEYVLPADVTRSLGVDAIDGLVASARGARSPRLPSSPALSSAPAARDRSQPAQIYIVSSLSEAEDLAASIPGQVEMRVQSAIRRYRS